MKKFIFVVGGVLSGVGKGIASASIAKILQEYGYKLTIIKIDPYLNCDAGTLRPTEHGEVWVTEDGGEIDQDLGNYERFLNQNIPKSNNITTGQIYREVIEKERQGKFLGQTVQFIPHIIQEIDNRIKESSKDADITVIEIGGTVGDYENVAFLLAAKNLEQKYGKENVIFVLVSYLPVPGHIKEPKTKPTQQAIKMLRETGIWPDFILCRSKELMDDVRRKKINFFLNIGEENIISAPDVSSIYQVPLNFEREEFGKKILSKLKLNMLKKPSWDKFEELTNNLVNCNKTINIGIIGKYLDIGNYTLEDSYISIKESLQHASAHFNVKPNIFWIDSKEFNQGDEKLKILDKIDGVIIPGGFGNSGVDGKINAIKFCRENKIPFLGLCYGLQLAVVEFAKNICKLNAHSTEIIEDIDVPIIDLMPWQKELLKENKYGATMRLGAYACNLQPDTIVLDLYKKLGRLDDGAFREFFKLEPKRIGLCDKNNLVFERHRHRYEVNPDHIQILKDNGLVISGVHLTQNNTQLVEFIELPKRIHPFFVATQAHPEFKSSLENPSPLFFGFVQSSLEKNKSAINNI